MAKNEISNFPDSHKCNKVKYDDKKINNYDGKKINNIIQNDIYKNFIQIKETIKKELNDNNSEKKPICDDILPKIFDLFNNFNSASAIGTLEFVDSLAKYNTIKSICERKDI